MPRAWDAILAFIAHYTSVSAHAPELLETADV